VPEETKLHRRAAEISQTFGAAIKRRRTALRITQDDLALATGVGRRFIIDLESGKPTAQLGRGLLVAERLGFVLGPPPVLAGDRPLLPDLPDDPLDG
jgi:transcriptional regulator with XRE-family HTH domain